MSVNEQRQAIEATKKEFEERLWEAAVSAAVDRDAEALERAVRLRGWIEALDLALKIGPRPTAQFGVYGRG